MPIRAFAVDYGYAKSETIFFVYKIKEACEYPTIIRYNNYVEVSLTAVEGAVTYYTTDGSEPTADGILPSENSLLYTEPFTINDDITIKTIAVKAGMATSDINAFSYQIERTITPEFTETMTASGKVIELSCTTPNSRIYYTLNGDTPTEQSIPYTQPFKLKKNTVLSFIAVHDNIRMNKRT